MLASALLHPIAHVLILYDAVYTFASPPISTRWPPTPSRRELSTVDNYCIAYGIVDDVAAATSIAEPSELSLGMGIINILTTEDDVWHEDALERVMIERCQEDYESTRVRYVTNRNITAARDQYGDCIQTSDGDQNAYAAGLCEVVANCYWNTPEEDQDRSRRYTDEQYIAAENAAQEHLSDRVSDYGTFGFALAVAAFIGCSKFAITRGVYGKCLCDGDVQRERVGYTVKEQLSPVMVYFVGLALVTVAGALGLQGGPHITRGLDMMFTTIDETYEGVQEFSSSVSSPLNSFLRSLNQTKMEVETLLARGDWLSDLENGLSLRLAAFEAAHGHRFESGSADFDALGLDVVNAAASFVTGVADDISVAADVLQEDFLDMEDLFTGSGGNVLAALQVVNDTVKENRDRVAYFRTLADKYAQVPQTSMVALMGSVVAAGVIGAIGVFSGISVNKPCLPCIDLLRITCIVAALATWFAFTLSAIFMAAAVTWSDGCRFLDLGVRQGWETAGLGGQSSIVLNGCLAGEAVLDVFNFTTALGFVESYPTAVVELEAYNDTERTAGTQAAIYALSDFIDSLNATKEAVASLDFYTNAVVNGSLLLDANCPYNVSFAFEDSVDTLGRPWLVTTSAVNATTSWEAGGASQSFERQGNESALSYMSRVFNSSECSLNDDLLSAWQEAVREGAIRDQMKDDLICTSDQESNSSNSSNSSLAHCARSTPYSFSTSSTFDLSPCGCTSDNYTDESGVSDTLLEHFVTYVSNVTDIRDRFIALFNVSSLLFSTSEADSSTTSAPTEETGREEDRGVLGDLAATAVLARCTSRCSFLTLHYASFRGAMCGTVLSGLSQVGFSMFMFGAGALALVASAGIMVHRLKADWAGSLTRVFGTEEGVVMEEY